MLTKFNNYLQSKGLKQSTINDYISIINKFLEWYKQSCDSYCDITNIDNSILEKYMLSLPNSNNSRSSLNKKISSINKFCDWAFDNNIIKTNSKLKLEKEKETLQVLPITLAENEILALRRKISYYSRLKDSAMFETLLDTGIKASELCSLKRADIININNMIFLAINTARERRVRLGPHAITAISKYLSSRNDDNPYLFVGSKTRDKITRIAVYNTMKFYAKETGCDVTPDILRNTFIKQLLIRKGYNNSAVLDILGNSVSNSMLDAINKQRREEIMGYIENLV